MQGASLAADRGRLEVEINRCHEEIEALKVKLKSSEDTVKIKDKIIDDQAQSIRALRQSVADKEREMQEGTEELRFVCDGLNGGKGAHCCKLPCNLGKVLLLTIATHWWPLLDLGEGMRTCQIDWKLNANSASSFRTIYRSGMGEATSYPQLCASRCLV